MNRWVIRLVILTTLLGCGDCSEDAPWRDVHHGGIGDDAICSSNSKCVGLEGACCPTAGGPSLRCCGKGVFSPGHSNHSAACSENDQCHGLDGDCCPTEKGLVLDCCMWTRPPAVTVFQCHASVGCASAVGSCCPAPDGSIPACCSAATSCTLLSSGFAMLVLASIFSISMVTLIGKYYVLEVALGEGHMRTTEEFALDVGKQICGAGWTPVANLLCAKMFNDQNDLDQCTAYWLNTMMVTTFGVLIEYAVLTLLEWAIESSGVVPNPEDFKSGEYMDNNRQIKCEKIFKQLVVWLSVVTFMKVVITFIVDFVTPFSRVAMGLLSPLNQYPDMKLWVVMILTPCVMYALQFFMCDVFLKKEFKEGPAEDPYAPYIPVYGRAPE